MTPDRRRALVAADALQDAWLAGSAAYWERRARQLEAARPRRGDYVGNSTPAELVARYDRLTEAAAACRARATGADGWATRAFADTFQDITGEEAA